METIGYIVFAILLLRTILSPFIKTRRDILCCGLFGFCGFEKPDLNAIKILGFANDSRGKDSCGYYYNGALLKGVNDKKTFYKLMQNTIINNEEVTDNTFIGHTRYLTVGSATEENAHPFMINDKWIIAHNGTIENIWDLCKKYDVDVTNIHVDSKALATLIDKVGFSVLEEYKGYAALLMHNKEEPNTLYVYHGSSKKYEKGAEVEERPLFFMTTEKGVYFSSLEEPLSAIRTSMTQKVETLSHNWVLKIQDGVFMLDEAQYIDRTEMNVGIDYKTTTNFTPASTKTTTTQIPSVVKKHTAEEANITGLNIGITNSVDAEGLDVQNESTPEKAFASPYREKVVYYRNRYHATKSFIPASGKLFLDKDGVIYQTPGVAIHPYFFFNGILLENETALRDFLVEDTSDANLAFYLSKHSKYPVTNDVLSSASTHATFRSKFFHKGRLANTSVTPLFSDRTYVYSKGVLKSIRSASGEKTVLNSNVSDMKAIEKFSYFINEGTVRQKALDKLYEIMGKKFTTKEQIINELPAEVNTAIRHYIRDIYDEKLAEIPSQVEYNDAIFELVDTFYEEMIEAEFSVINNMDGGSFEPHQYLLAAYDEIYFEDAEVGEDEEDVTESFDDYVKDINSQKSFNFDDGQINYEEYAGENWEEEQDEMVEYDTIIKSFLYKFEDKMNTISHSLVNSPTEIARKNGTYIRSFLHACKHARTKSEKIAIVNKIKKLERSEEKY